MLYNVLIESSAANPDDKESIELFTQYERQRVYFLSRRIAEIKEAYGLEKDEEEILLGFFNTSERENSQSGSAQINQYKILSVFKHHKDEDELVDDQPIYRSSIGWLRIYWSTAWVKFANYNKFNLSARFAIKQHKIKDIKKTYELVAIADLANDLKVILPGAERAIELPLDTTSSLAQELNENGILEIDIRKLNWLKQNNIGSYTKKYIAEFQELINNPGYNMHRRLEVWDNPLYFSRSIAMLRWQDRIAKFVQRKQDNSPALAYQFFTQVNELTKRDTFIHDSGTQILSKEGKVVSIISKTPSTTLSAVEHITKSNIPELSSITSHYLWRWFIPKVHEQHLLDEEQPYKLEFLGGYNRLAEITGTGVSPKTISRIRNIIEIASQCIYTYQGKTGTFQGNMLSYEYFEAHGRKSSKLTITLARPLCPGFVEELPEGNSKYNHQKILIPWVKMPMLVGKNSAHHAPQSSFQLEMNAQMRLRASEIYSNGGILLNDDDMLSLAKGARLPSQLINKVIDTWVSEEYLERVDDCVYMLGNRYPEARESLKIAGELSVKSAEKGRIRKRVRSENMRGMKK